MENPVERRVLPAVVGFAPVVLLLLTQDYGVKVAESATAAKWFAGPVLVAEIFVILVALREGGLSALRRAAVPPLVRAASVVLLTVALLTAALAATMPFNALILTALWILHVLYGLSVLYLCGRAFDRRSFTTTLMAGFVAFAILLTIFVIRVPDPANFDWVAGLPAVAHLRHLGFYAGAVIGLCIGRFATTRSAIGWTATLATAAFGFAVPLWSGSRGTFAAVTGSLVVGLLLFPMLRSPKVLFGIAGSLLLGFALTAPLPVPHETWGAGRMVATVTSGNVTSDRNVLWRATLDAIAERPWFGHGEGQLQAVTVRRERHPHNILLQVLLAWGIVGAACAVTLAVVFAGQVIRNVRTDGGERLAPCMALLVLAAYSAYDGALFFPLSLSLAATFAGLVASPARCTGALPHPCPKPPTRSMEPAGAQC